MKETLNNPEFGGGVSSVLKTGLTRPVEPGPGEETGSIKTVFMAIYGPVGTGRFDEKTGSTNVNEPVKTGIDQWINGRRRRHVRRR